MPLSLSQIVDRLDVFWRSQGCEVIHGYDLEEGAATLGPDTFLRALGTQPWRLAYVDPCRRPSDARYGGHGVDRYQRFYQYQVLLKPPPAKPQAEALVRASLEAVDPDGALGDVVFTDDTWTSPVFGAHGQGWEVWAHDTEIAQVTYLDEMGGVPCELRPLEVTYGLERLAGVLQGVDDFNQLAWGPSLTYGDLHAVAEAQQSAYLLEHASVDRHERLMAIYLDEVEDTIDRGLVFPALDGLLRAAHCFNVVEARKGGEYPPVASEALARIQQCATAIAMAYLDR